jgi:phage baseplate assembly protein V
MNLDQFRRAVAPIRNQIFNLLGRGLVSRVDDSTALQQIQARLHVGETRDEMERFQNYGITSKPFVGAEALVVFLNGHRDDGIVVAIDDRRYRLTGLVEGEVALYTDEGDTIVIKRGGHIEVNGHGSVKVAAPEIEANATTRAKVSGPNVEVVATTKVTVTSPLVEMTGALSVTGAVTAGSVTAGGIGLASHSHGVVGAVTSAPGAVTFAPSGVTLGPVP